MKGRKPQEKKQRPNKKAGPLLIPGALLAVAGIVFVIGQEVSVSWISITENFAGNPVAYSFGILAAAPRPLYSNLTRRWAEVERRGGRTFHPCHRGHSPHPAFFHPRGRFLDAPRRTGGGFSGNRYGRGLYSLG